MLTDEKTPGREEAAIWEGEPIEFSWEGDRYQYGGLVSTVRLPARHVHPAVHAAAEAVVAAQNELAKLRQEIAARRPALDRLRQKLASETRGKSAPERAKAARQLTDFQSETNLIEAAQPDADQAVRDALQVFADIVNVYGHEWNDYLYNAGAVAVQKPVGFIGGPSRMAC